MNHKSIDKKDDGKPDWTLLPIKPLIIVIEALEFGLKKYGRDNWKTIADGKHRYIKAAFRHIAAMADGEWLDQESKLPHAACAVCSLLFVLWFGE